MLKWSISELVKYRDQPLHFTTTLDLKKELMARDPEILDMTPLTVDGYISYDKGDLLVSVTLGGKMVIPSTRSLTPVDWPLDFTFTEIYLLNPADKDKYDDGQLLIDLDGSELDLHPAIADHVLLSIPMQVLTPEEEAGEAMPEGDDWSVVGEADYEAGKAEQQTANPAFAKLKQLFPEDDDELKK